MTERRIAHALAALAVTLALLAATATPGPAQQRPAPAPRGSEPHAAHGTPMGWKFALPKGEAAKGREVFAKLECYSCHEVRGEKFPAPTEQAKVGPELSMMGPLHEAEYFAEAVINPSAVVDKSYAAPDGSSKMPSFNDSLTVQELVDLVAYLRALRPSQGGPAGHGGH